MAITKKGLTKRELGAIETKNRLFSVALQLFAKHGYEKVTVDDITQFAGVSKGNFYTHFESKDAVLVEQFQRIDEYYTSTFKQAPATLSIEEKLLLLVRSMCEYCEDICGVTVIKIVYSNQIGLGERTKILLNRDRVFYDIIQNIVKEGMDSGYFVSDMTEEEIIQFISAATRNILYEWCLHDGEESLKEEGERVFKRFLKCIRA